MKLSTLILQTLLLVPISSFAQLPNYVPANGLIAYYGFNGNANDASINANNGTVHGATSAVDRHGSSNSAYYFDGISNYIELPFNQTPVSDYSISAWFKTTGGGTIIGTSSSLASNKMGVKLYLHDMVTDGANPYQFMFVVSGLGYECGSRSNQTYNDDEWHHVVGVWDATVGSQIDVNQFKIYIDGVLTSQHGTTSVGNGGSTGPLNAPTTDNGNYIIARNIVFNTFFKGSIDDIALYDRPLTQCEVYSLYTSGAFITKEPINDTATIGSSAEFSISSTFIGGAYQWQMDNGTGFTNLTNAGVYSGVNTDTLKISTTTLNMNNNLYRCIIYGNCSDTSEHASLTVKNNTGIAHFENNEVITISPNPASNFLTIKNKEDIETTFTDMSGRKVKRSTLKIIDVSDLTNGVYILNINSLNKSDVMKVSILH